MKSHLNWLILVFFFSSSAFAGSVIKVNDKKVYIKFTADDSFTEGDIFYLTNPEGKKIGLVQLQRVKGLKAIGILKKGKAASGNATLFKGVGKSVAKKGSLSDDSSSSDSEESSSPAMKSRWGGMLGYGMATQDVTQPTGTSSQSGSSIAIKLLYEMPIYESISLRVLGGFEIFSVSGTGREPGNTVDSTVGTDVTYGTADAIFRWNLSNSATSSFYLLGGMGLWYPVSSSSTSIDPDTITSFAIGEVGVGYEMKMQKFNIPIDLTYYYFPAGEEVETSVISLKAGIIF